MPLPAKFPALPFTTPISPTIKPVTASLKVNVTGIGVTFVGLEAVLVMVMVGGDVSTPATPVIATASISFHPTTTGEFIAMRMASTK